MSTRIDIFTYGIWAISATAAVTDLAFGRIYNWLTLSAVLAGIVASFFSGGWHGVLGALGGVLAGLILYGWMFFVGAMGGGDVKLLMALGAWGGPRYAEEVAVLGVLLGGAMALLVMLFSGRLPGFFTRMKHFLQTLLIKELQVEKPKIDWKFTLPYGVPIAVAAVWVAWSHPLAGMGMPLWP